MPIPYAQKSDFLTFVLLQNIFIGLWPRPRWCHKNNEVNTIWAADKAEKLACLLTRDCTRTTTTRTQGCKWVSAESTFSVSSLYISSRSVVCWKQVRFFRASKDVPNDPTTCVKYTLVLPTLICDKMGSCGGRQKIVHKMSSRISQRLNYKVSTKLMLIY